MTKVTGGISNSIEKESIEKKERWIKTFILQLIKSFFLMFGMRLGFSKYPKNRIKKINIIKNICPSEKRPQIYFMDDACEMQKRLKNQERQKCIECEVKSQNEGIRI